MSEAEYVLRLEIENTRLAGRVDRLTIAIDAVRAENRYTFLLGVSLVDGNYIRGVMLNLGPVVILLALRKRNNDATNYRS